MPSPAWENLDDFLDTDDFAVFASIAFQAGGAPRADIKGIFDEPYMNSQLGEYDFDTSKPRFTAKESDFVGVDRGDVVTLYTKAKTGAITWTKTFDIMTGAQSTGDGMAVLELTEA